MKTFLLILLLLSSVYGKEPKPVCFENSFMFVNRKYKINKVKIYFNDALVREDQDDINYSQLYYTLENEHTYAINDLLCEYDVNSSIYSCGVETDGGFLEYDTKNHVMYMDGLNGYERIDFNPFPDRFTDRIFSPEQGELDTAINKDEYYNRETWVYEKKCKDIKKPKETRNYYTREEYIEAFPNSKKRDSYFKRFNKPLIKREDESEIEHIKLKESYRSIAKMMNYEGFDFNWAKIEDIELFVYDTKRAFIRFSPYVPKNTSGCFCGGYKLLEINGDDLTILSFGWECGSVVAPIFETETWVEEVKI